MEIVFVTLGIVLAVLVAWQFFATRKMLEKLTESREKDQSLLMVQQRIDNITKELNERLAEVARSQDRSTVSIGERLDNAAKVVGAVQHKLGGIEESSKRIFDVGKDIASLQEILRAPKLRGMLGELFLGDLLAQILPQEHYMLQYRFKSGEVVDAVVKLRDEYLVPVDSKFPLENFKRVIEAQDDEERKRARKVFLSDVKKHIDAIAAKYILPDEKTFDFALMYVPAENVYYDMIVKDAEGTGISDYALQKKVIPVSPNSFYIYLQAIVLGLRGMRIEQSAKDILLYLQRLRGDFGKFSEDYRVLGKHLGYAKNSYDESEKRLEKVSDKLESIGEGRSEKLITKNS
ncbi:MAG: hypothetical protein COT39_01570 [Parcubacteria group bacterium CG08_land_8_20_14_0_20_48_21]|nr:MAG: hypothetical protein AUK21_03520 [Parcubacteria group bacterium CG2_30_48_51]PIS33003.1 MAG: hypothetical protein COT39_01570 [Parcubacteria group bacterium CG08_land_8_20_14_0_20_48_21]PIW79548.1 MAG: hypothetical protein COZ99_00405 [Parcubacteria group bacterium CG_4_8_14_3_um_filter_48_16]PIY77631.1 MAG: hypothetical protein COY83_04165 [Parcubacteria group bacterium CG_4_10_14_0_8_um_filter_48_154]PIZ77243.1 MAG: hypothetical protein COY03_03480 [bacterium CG_4_10_14_0_2_um_filter_